MRPRTFPEKTENLAGAGFSSSGRYWARTSDPQLVELVLMRRFTGIFRAVEKYLGKSHSGESGFRRSCADASRMTPRP